MTDRVRNPQDIRIVPNGATTSGASPSQSSSANATAVQIFRLLASQAQAGPLSMPTISADAPSAEASDVQGSNATGEACAATAPAQSREPQQAPTAAHEAHEATKRDPSPGTEPTGLRNTAHRATPKPEQPEHDAALGKQIVQVCAMAAHGELFTRELTDRIARFCSMSGTSDGTSWAVTLPMNPAVLPDTLLHLQLSPSSIAIRFETSNPRATQLISDNADALRKRLTDALGRQIDVEVDA
ncbi:type III secretion system protein SctP [Trinickia acidisoli]|uniref:type III secretion system protein SctP n=1 Tax=Trinickia acidisoli TaxID=2767482 RepID=UPI001A8CDBA3|nr:type III secretion system protein SctP [Trinickia acidisoli]